MTKKEYEAIQYLLLEVLVGGSEKDKLAEATKVTASYLIEVEIKDEK